MEQPNKPYDFPAREILIPALKVGALTGKLVLLTYGTSICHIFTSFLYKMRIGDLRTIFLQYAISSDYSTYIKERQETQCLHKLFPYPNCKGHCIS